MSTEWWQISEKIIIYHISSSVDPHTTGLHDNEHIPHRTTRVYRTCIKIPASHQKNTKFRCVPVKRRQAARGAVEPTETNMKCVPGVSSVVLSWQRTTHVCSNNNSNKMTLNCSNNISSCSHSLAFPWNTGRTLNLRIEGPVNRFFFCFSSLCSFLWLAVVPLCFALCESHFVIFCFTCHATHSNSGSSSRA